MPSQKPSLAELRAVCQPPSVLGRRNAEHWAGLLYMRRASIHLTRALLPTGISANAVTWLFIVTGLAAGAVLLVPGLWGGLGCLVLIQLWLLLDCSDGEVARWHGTTSAAGVYLDRVGHYTTDAALLAGLGVRADGGAIGGWTTLGLGVAVLALLVKAETDLVHVSRALAGLAPAGDDAAPPRSRGLRSARQLVGRLPFYRALNAIELSGLIALAAVLDAVSGGVAATRALLAALLVVAAVVLVGHLVSVLASGRLR